MLLRIPFFVLILCFLEFPLSDHQFTPQDEIFMRRA
ncbi:tRNA adenosine(34) deaminase TadA, partial [Vibrio splendidus]